MAAPQGGPHDRLPQVGVKGNAGHRAFEKPYGVVSPLAYP
ncbi:hypothetical protein SAURM35S_08690 [Streptomyces aurantiogriseus]